MRRILVDKNVEIPMRDGVVLRGDVWRADDGRPRPALFMATPYNKDAAGPNWSTWDQLVLAGYVAVVVDTRGRFASDGDWGCATSDDAMWGQDGRDCHDAVEWIAGQQWCDGGVGMLGLSYPGGLCWLAAAEQPPHLKAIAPAMIMARDHEHLDTAGLPWLAAKFGWYLAMFATAKGIALNDATELMIAVRDYARSLEHLPLRESPGLQPSAFPIAIDDILRGERGVLPSTFDLDSVRVPTLVIGGWYDAATTANVFQFDQLRSSAGATDEVRAAHRLVLGPWTHGGPGPALGEVDFGMESAMGLGLRAPAIAFFDRHLKGVSDDTPAVRYFVMGSNDWRACDAWPPSQAQTQTWYLHSAGRANTSTGDGVLRAASPDAEETPDGYDYDPADPVRSRGGRKHFGTVPGPFDQSSLESRSDVLCYTSEPLAESIDIVGNPELTLYASSSAVDTDFMVQLLDVQPDGRAIEFSSGLVRARLRKGIDEKVLLQPGVVEQYTIGLSPTAQRVAAGHRLRLHVCSSDFPFFDRNLNTGNAVGVDALPVVAQQSIFHDAARPSRLVVPTTESE